MADSRSASSQETDKTDSGPESKVYTAQIDKFPLNSDISAGSLLPSEH